MTRFPMPSAVEVEAGDRCYSRAKRVKAPKVDWPVQPVSNIIFKMLLILPGKKTCKNFGVT